MSAKTSRGCKRVHEGGISCFFYTVSRSRLIALLQKKIKDERIISLIFQGLKTKILIPETGEAFRPGSGVPKGSVLNPLLSNIYLHKLDEHTVRSTKEFNVDTARPHLSEYRKAARKLGLTPIDMFSDAFKRMKYVRYVGDFVVGLTCSRAQALVIKPHIKIFLQN
jgi:retron-type reverse transcriptase